MSRFILKKYFLTPLLEDLTHVCTVVSSAYSTERNIVQKKPSHICLKIPGTGVNVLLTYDVTNSRRFGRHKIFPRSNFAKSNIYH